MCCFFFSSRRRHTRCLSDWSSDVCSSDLKCWTYKGEILDGMGRGASLRNEPEPRRPPRGDRDRDRDRRDRGDRGERRGPDRKSTRLNSSHLGISYAVFCLKKKTKQNW